MIILKRITPYWTTLFLAGGLLFGLYFPGMWRWVISGLIILPIIQALVVRQTHWRYEYLGFSLPMIVLLLSGYSFSIIQESVVLIYISIGLTIVLWFLFSKNLNVFLYQPAKYIPYSLEHISTYSNIIASFYLYVTVFMFFILGVGRLRFVMLVVLLGTLTVCWQTFWIQKVAFARAKWYIVAITIVTVEAVWALHFWPVGFFTSGFILTIVVYLLLHLSRNFVTEELTRRRLTRYLATAGIAVVAAVVTARWF